MARTAQPRRNAATARATLLARAADDLALIAEKRREISGAFYESGEALLRLREPAVMKALECATFAARCARADLSASVATSRVEIVERVKRADALAWGHEKSAAVAEAARVDPRRRAGGGRTASHRSSSATHSPVTVTGAV